MRRDSPRVSQGNDNMAFMFDTFGPQRNVFGTFTVEGGSFYGCRRPTTMVSGARARILNRLSVEPSVSITRLRLPSGDATVRLAGSRVTCSPTPMSRTFIAKVDRLLRL